MGRTICVELPVPPSTPLGMTVPGIGRIEVIKQFSLEGYDVCADARSFLSTIQPLFSALGMPLCILGCLTSVVNVFGTDFPYIKPQALLKIPEKCACLTSFTPFGFCGLLRGVLIAIQQTLLCVTGMLGDLVKMESQIASLLSDPSTREMGVCLRKQADALRQNVQQQFGPVTTLFNASSFLFSFVGVSVPSLDVDLSGKGVGETLEVLSTIQQTIVTVVNAVEGICPPGV